ncbi:MAG TPA: hypothetical protein VH475_28130 [Tepidisphaeraceae bacterium]|jgi:hypothetical protein
MSPTATIACVVAALLLVAWLFQSNAPDPGYDAMLRRLEEQKKIEQASAAPLPVNLTDPGVSKGDPNARPDPRGAAAGQMAPSYQSAGSAPPVIVDPTAELAAMPRVQPPPDPSKQPVVRPADLNPKLGFGKNARLSGTFVASVYASQGAAGDPADAAPEDPPSITFRRDGTFTTVNMAAADVDMESGLAAGAAPLDRGSGRYKLSSNTLELTYTDGLSRKKGPHRAYTVFAVDGDESAPTAITIQGKVFKLDADR